MATEDLELCKFEVLYWVVYGYRSSRSGNLILVSSLEEEDLECSKRWGSVSAVERFGGEDIELKILPLDEWVAQAVAS